MPFDPNKIVRDRNKIIPHKEVRVNIVPESQLKKILMHRTPALSIVIGIREEWIVPVVDFLYR
jgi:hypothetical protein